MPTIRPSSDLMTYEKLVGNFELHKLLDEGLEASQRREVRPLRYPQWQTLGSIPIMDKSTIKNGKVDLTGWFKDKSQAVEKLL
ncbi:hypothetical protein [Paenibacillus sp. 1P07SE]|uniref:hypothetical protein n=1 Tax=Paenibacillus sp. 1P07SE TaxID=3132209 RepID=UPI0039A66802